LVEREVSVRVRKQDLSLVEVAIKSASAAFKEKFGYEVHVTIDSDKFLPDARYLKIQLLIDLQFYSAGGVILLANNGKIQVKNTLESRLDLAAEAMLPAIRMLSYGPSPNRRFFD
jgi:vacuolar-type H+-ATPase subunit E/Vma4